MGSGTVGIDATTMCEQQPAEQPADEPDNPSENVSVDQMIERVQRRLFESGTDTTPP